MDYFLFNFSGVQFHYTMSLIYGDIDNKISVWLLFMVAIRFFVFLERRVWYVFLEVKKMTIYTNE